MSVFKSSLIIKNIFKSAALLLSSSVVSLTASFGNAIRHFAKTLIFILKV